METYCVNLCKILFHDLRGNAFDEKELKIIASLFKEIDDKIYAPRIEEHKKDIKKINENIKNYKEIIPDLSKMKPPINRFC